MKTFSSVAATASAVLALVALVLMSWSMSWCAGLGIASLALYGAGMIADLRALRAPSS